MTVKKALIVLALVSLLPRVADAASFPNSISTQKFTAATSKTYDLSLSSKYIAYSDNASAIGWIDLITGAIYSPSHSFLTPRGIVIESDDTHVYVAEYGANCITPVLVSGPLVETSVTVGTSPWGLVLSGSTIGVTNYGSSNVMAVDTSTGGVVATVTSGNNPKGIAVEGGGSKVYIANSGSDYGTVITTSSLEIGQIPLGSVSVDVAVSENDRAYFVRTDGNVQAVNTDDNSLVGTPINIGGTPRSIAVYSPSSGSYDYGYDYVYVTGIPLNGLTIVEFPVNPSDCPGAVPRILQTIVGITGSEDIVIQSNGAKAYVARNSGNSITVLEKGGPQPAIKTGYYSCLNATTQSSTTVSFSTNNYGGNYQVEIGGSGITGCGTMIASGTIGGSSSAQFSVNATDLTTSTYNVTQKYSLYVFITDSFGRTGSAGFDITLDTIPPSEATEVTARSGDEEVGLSWTALTSDVAGYNIYFTTDTGRSGKITTGPISSLTIKNLENNVLYYFTVTAFDCASNEGPASSQVRAFPGHVRGPAERAGEEGGCFIATEVFGPLSFEVEVLRTFRDKIIMSSVPGKWFVSLYYKYSPFWAVFLHNRPFLKGLVRIALVPVVFGAWLILEGAASKVFFLLLLISGIIFAVYKRKWLEA